MADASKIFKNNFLEYASYVIKDRATPYLEDGFKPVQRRILHTMIEMDDGRFHKVANIVGQVMKLHPHGDASIGDALVNLAQSKYFIDTQGNFGNILTGDPAAAPRYIEARILPFAKKVLYSSEITTYVDSYDSRNKEPEVFPAKLPIVLLLGANGIQVTMKTCMLPHNPIEIIDAIKSELKGEVFVLYPDFQTGGIVDVSEYDDGRGKVSVRAKVQVDKKNGRLVIEEVPYGVTTDDLIQDIDRVTKLGKLKIATINDYTAGEANIELNLQRGADPDAELQALYAYTKAETKITLSPIVIKDGKPIVMGVSEIISYHTERLLTILTKELEVEKGHLLDKLQARTLERIFIEERIYKRIEEKRTSEEVKQAVIDGLMPFKAEFVRDLTDDDTDHLLQLPIRRISLFDIEKNKKDIEEINALLQKADYNLSHIKEYANTVLDDIKNSLPEGSERKTEVASFETVNVRSVVSRNLQLHYDSSNGQLGTEVKTGETLFKVSEYDKILIIQKDGSYRVENTPTKLYVGKGMLFCGFADKDTLKDIVFTILLQEKDTKAIIIKRCKITAYTLSKLYTLLPQSGNFKILSLSTLPNATLSLTFKSSRCKDKTVYFSDFAVKAANTQGVVLTRNEVQKLRIKAVSDDAPSSPPAPEDPGLF